MKRHLEELPAPPAWKREVRAALRDRGLSQQDLAVRVGSSKAAISQLLSRSLGQETSRLVVAISRALDVELPLEARVQLAAKKLASRNNALLLKVARALEAAVDAAAAADELDDGENDG